MVGTPNQSTWVDHLDVGYTERPTIFWNDASESTVLCSAIYVLKNLTQFNRATYQWPAG